ncbi:hypothetical protein M8C21_031614, partial [Ambrosia artemisiifolia]
KGHINPALRFANCLLKLGVDVTFCTSLSVVQLIDKETIPQGLTFAPFSDGHDKGKHPNTTLQQFISDFETNGARAAAEVIASAAGTRQPFDCLVYTTVIPWAARVAHAHGIKSALLWCQPATVLNIYYYYLNEYHSLISSNNNSPNYIEWLNTQAKSSVVYVSFGTIASFQMEQLEEMAVGLKDIRRPFLWVIRDSNQAERVRKIVGLQEHGMIALVAGLRIVAFPQWSDQPTNAKMVEDVWKTGVRVRTREGDGMVEGKEIARCVEMVIENKEMKANTEKWKEVTREALKDGGSSTKNLQSFLDDL